MFSVPTSLPRKTTYDDSEVIFNAVLIEITLFIPIIVVCFEFGTIIIISLLIGFLFLVVMGVHWHFDVVSKRGKNFPAFHSRRSAIDFDAYATKGRFFLFAAMTAGTEVADDDYGETQQKTDLKKKNKGSPVNECTE